MRLTRPNDTIDHVSIGTTGGQFAIGAGSADEFLRGAIVQTDREPLDFQRLFDLPAKGF